MMRTVQMTLHEELVARVDEAVRELGTTRSAFAREALTQALVRLREAEQERRHREGYRRRPVQVDELGDGEAEQVWPD